MEIWKQIFVRVSSGVITFFVIRLISPYFDFIAAWITNQIWQTLIGLVIGTLISWKIFEIWRFLVRVVKSIWRFICGVCRWVKNIFTINKLYEKTDSLKTEIDIKGNKISYIENKTFEIEKIVWSLRDTVAKNIKGFNETETSTFLKIKSKSLKCPVCGNNEFSLLEGLFYHINIKSSGNISVPSVATFCTNCGLLNFHARKFIEIKIEEEKNNRKREREDKELERKFLKDLINRAEPKGPFDDTIDSAIKPLRPKT
jgi:hypothetical protein